MALTGHALCPTPESFRIAEHKLSQKEASLPFMTASRPLKQVEG